MPQLIYLSYIRILFLSILIQGCSFFLFSTSGFAQSATNISSKDSTLVKEILAIPLANISSETESTLGMIREIQGEMKPSSIEVEIDSMIPKRLQIVEQWRKDVNPDKIGEMSIRQIDNLKNDFKQMRDQLDKWRGLLTNKIDDVSKMKKDLVNYQIEWEKTLNAERDEQLPSEITERIKTNLQEVNALNKELSSRSNALLAKQEELTKAFTYINDVLNKIGETEQSYRTQILTIDSPPIWLMFTASEDTVTFKTKVKEVVKSHTIDLIDFSENYRESFYYHAFFFIVLLVLTFYLKNDVSKWSDDKKDDTIGYSLHIISKPFWASLLIALLSTRLFYGEMPGDVNNYFVALLVLPILTLVPGLIPEIEKKYFLLIGGIFVLTQVADYLSDLVILDRVILLVLDILTIVLLVSILRKKKEIDVANSNINWGFTFAIMKLSVILLSISLISNTLGNTILSKLLSGGSLIMIYGGIIIYASALILKGLTVLIMQQEKVSKLNIIINYSDEVKKRTFNIIRWAAVIYWLYISLSGFAIYDPVYDWFEGFITTEWVIGSVSLSLGSILAFFITLWLTVLISRFIIFILQDEILTHLDMPRGVPGAISMLVKLILFTLGFVLAFGAAKIPFDNIAIIFGALGVGIGFGLQNIFNNLVSGLILAFERPIQSGDVIQIATLNLMGEVKEIGIRASTVRTFDGAEVIVPNGNLISNELINWTLSDHRRRQEILVGVAYGTDTNKVLEILKKVVPEQKNVLKNPSPTIIFLGFGDSSLDFRVLFWCRFDEGLGTKSAVGTAIDEAFKKEGIEIPFPQRDLHLRSISDGVDLQQGAKLSKPSNPKKPVVAKATKTPKKLDGKS